jgi:hypothetical protein
VRLGPLGPPPPPPHWVGEHTLEVLSAAQLVEMDAAGHWAHQHAPPPAHAATGRRLLHHPPAPQAPLHYHLRRLGVPGVDTLTLKDLHTPKPPAPSMPQAPYEYRIGGSGIGGYDTLDLKDDGETLTSEPLTVGRNTLFVTVL